MTFCRVKKWMCSSRWWKYPAVLLLSWLSSELWLASALAEHDAGQHIGHSFLCLARYRAFGTRCMLWPQERNTVRWECSRESLGELDLPFLLSSDGSYGLIPIDHVRRVGQRNNPPHGSSNSSQPGLQWLWHERNRKQDHFLLLPLELSFPKPLSALPVVRLCSDCPMWMGAYIPFAQDQAQLGKCA